MRGKCLHPGNRIAIDGGRFRFEIGLGAVKSALVAGQFDALDAGLEIAPHHVAAAPVDPHIELAGSRRILLDQRVIAIDRIIVVGIEPPQKLARILLVHIGKQRIEVFLVGIERCRDDVTALDLAFQIEGEPPLAVDGVVLTGLGRCQQRTVMAGALADRQIGKSDIEPLTVGNVDIAFEFDAAPAIPFINGDIDHMFARRQDALHDEIAAAGNRHFPVHDTHRQPLRHVLAVDRHHPAIDRDACPRQLVGAIGRQWRGGPFRNNAAARLIAVEHHRRKAKRIIADHQRQGFRFVEPATTVIHPQHVEMIALCIRSRQPGGCPFPAHGNNRNRLAIAAGAP